MVNNETPVDEFSPNMIIRQVKSDSMHDIPVEIENVGMRAVVDTTDALTMIPDILYKDLNESLPLTGSERAVQTAGSGMSIEGSKVGPVSLSIGGKVERELGTNMSEPKTGEILGVPYSMHGESRSVASKTGRRKTFQLEKCLSSRKMEPPDPSKFADRMRRSLGMSYTFGAAATAM